MKPGAATAPTGPIRSTRQVRALGSPARQEVLDAVESAGPCTVASVAASLGRPADGLYFHVRALEKAGLLRRTGTAGEGRERAALYDVPHRPLRMDYAGPPAARAKRLGPVLDCLLRLARRDTARALASDDAVVEGPARDLWVARSRGMVTPEDLERINALLGECMDIVRNARAGDDARAVALVIALTPQGDQQDKDENDDGPRARTGRKERGR